MKKLLAILLLAAVFVLSGCYSCESYYGSKGLGTVQSHLAGKTCWSKDCKTWVAAQRRPAPAVALVAEPATVAEPAPSDKPAPVETKPAFVGACGPCTVCRRYPYGTPGVIQVDKAIWRMVVKAVKAGDVLFKVTLTGAEFSRHIEENESTNLYA